MRRSSLIRREPLLDDDKDVEKVEKKVWNLRCDRLEALEV